MFVQHLIYEQFKHELQVTQDIELANWEKLNQLESDIHANNQKILRNNEKVVDCLKKQVYNLIYVDCEL